MHDIGLSAFLLALVFPAHAACPVVVENRIVRGESMEPLFKNGANVRILRGYYACRPVRREDVVVYSFAADRSPIIKTVKAVAGDRFALKRSSDGAGWNVLINGSPALNSQKMPYTLRHHKMLASVEELHHGIIPERTCLLLGEMLGGSSDSSRFGLVETRAIAGKVDGLMLQ